VSSNHISIELAPLYSKNITPSLTLALSDDNPEFSTVTSPSRVNANPKVSTTVYDTKGVGVGGTGVAVGGTGVAVGLAVAVGAGGIGVGTDVAIGADGIGVGTDVATGSGTAVAVGIDIAVGLVSGLAVAVTAVVGFSVV
jgi:hypothetical protein